MWRKLRDIHPAWTIFGMFFLLIAANVTFFILATSNAPEIVPRSKPRPAVTLQHPAPGTPPLGAHPGQPSDTSRGGTNR